MLWNEIAGGSMSSEEEWT